MHVDTPVKPDDFVLTSAPDAWPLLFEHRGPVLGNGFVAIVEFHGRLLARERINEDGTRGLWLDGVYPGGFGLGACTVKEARLELQSALTGVLADIAEEADSFDTFKAVVEEFFWQTDPQTVGEWEACVREAQSGRLKPVPGIMPVMSADCPLLVAVTLKPAGDVTPKDNSAPGPVLASVA